MATPQPSPEFLAENSGHKLQAVAIVFIILTIASAILRAVSQNLRKLAFGFDDLFSYIALFFVLGECILALVMVPVAGVGRHVAYLEIAHPEKLAHEFIIMFPIEILYISAFTSAKLSILNLYLRIFSTKPMRRVTFILMAVVIMTWISETLSAIFQCTPVHSIWDKSIHGHCVDQDAMFRFWSIPNIITDAIMLILPLPLVWKLQLPFDQKVGLTFTFLLGSIGLVASIIRFVIFGETGALDDATWASVQLQIWTIIEPAMYYFAGILPTLRRVTSKFFTTVKGKISSKATSSSGPSRSGARYLSEGIHTIGGSRKDKKNWTPIDDDYSHHGGNGLALGEYSQNIVGGKDQEVNAVASQSGSGIIRTQEVRITRETV